MSDPNPSNPPGGEVSRRNFLTTWAMPASGMAALAAILVCLAFVTVDLGRPDRFWHLIHGIGKVNFPGSMLSWDVILLNGYLLLNVRICGYLPYCRYIGRQPTTWFYIPFVFIAIVWAVSIHTGTAFLCIGLHGHHAVVPWIWTAITFSFVAMALLVLPLTKRLNYLNAAWPAATFLPQSPATADGVNSPGIAPLGTSKP